MNLSPILTLIIAFGICAGAFIVTYAASRICFAVKKPADMLWAGMLCAAGLIYPMIFAGVYAETIMSPSAVPFVVLFTALASFGAHLLAMRKLK